ncbi:MAG: hypothetical protein ACK56I_27465, partial [bacterium]
FIYFGAPWDDANGFWHDRQPRIPASISLPDSALEPTSIEFVASFQSRCQRAWDVCREFVGGSRRPS